MYAYVNNEPLDLFDTTGLEPIPDCAKDALLPFFPDLSLDDLDLIDIQTDVDLSQDYPGMDTYAETSSDGSTISFAPGRYVFGADFPANVSQARGLALLAHELMHVQQIKDLEPIDEVEAGDKANEIRGGLYGQEPCTTCGN
jgi:hypothetical protein